MLSFINFCNKGSQNGKICTKKIDKNVVQLINKHCVLSNVVLTVCSSATKENKKKSNT